MEGLGVGTADLSQDLARTETFGKVWGPGESRENEGDGGGRLDG